ncbi:MAG: polysulfide reductase NrfD [Deltaproteobacteria bacterium]|nr:MAG: polysulfide reductase NrfD [Deltaproteobacteria bacterium]
MTEKNNKGTTLVWLGLLGIVIAVGLVAAFRLYTEGHYLFNTNDVIIWSLPLGVYVFLAITSSGLTLLAGLPLFFGLKQYEPFAKRMVFLAIATLCGAFVSIGLELGNVPHMIYIMLSPNFSSPIWWMGFIYSVELVVLIVKFWKMHTGDWHSSFSRFLGAASFFLALAAPLMIGSVFGLTESRVTYFGPVMSIYCLLMGLLSGLALFILYSGVVEKVTGTSLLLQQAGPFQEIVGIFRYVTGVVVGFTLVKFIIEGSTVVPEFLVYNKFAHAFGAWQGLHTEVILGLFLPFVLMLIPAVRKSRGGQMVFSALITVGTLAMVMEILLAGQSHPVGPKAEQFPEFISYFPSVWEWLVFLLSVAVMLLLYTLGEKYLKLEATPAEAKSGI